MVMSESSMEPNLNPSTLSAGDSPASRSPLPEADASRKTPAGSGLNSSDYFAWYDPDTHSLRMSQVSLTLGECLTYSGAWPDFGTMRNGLLFQPLPWVPRILGGAFSLLPTLTASERMNDPSAVPSQNTLDKFSRGEIKRVRKTRAATLSTTLGGLPNPAWAEWLMGFPADWTKNALSS